MGATSEWLVADLQNKDIGQSNTLHETFCSRTDEVNSRRISSLHFSSSFEWETLEGGQDEIWLQKQSL